MRQYRKQWHPDCQHAEHRGRLAPLVCDYHHCGVRAKSIYNERDCEGCANRVPLPPKEDDETTQEEIEMPVQPGFWSLQHSSGVTNLEHAKERIAAGETINAVENAMRGKATGTLNAALAYAKKQDAKKEGLAAPKPPVQRTPAQERVAQGLRGMKPAEEEQPEEPEPPKPVKPADMQELSALDAAGAADLRAFIRYIGREKQAEVALGFTQFRQAG